MMNIHWHAKIDAQQLFYFMILSVGIILIDLTVSIKGTLQRCPRNFYIWQVRRMLSQEPWKYPSHRGGAHWLKHQTTVVAVRWEVIKKNQNKLEQLERLRFEDTPPPHPPTPHPHPPPTHPPTPHPHPPHPPPPRTMSTHSIDSHWIPSQKKTKSKLQISRICQNFNFRILTQILHATHLLKQIWNRSSKYYWKYRADTIQSIDGQTDKVKPVYLPFNFVEAGGIMRAFSPCIQSQLGWRNSCRK